MALAVDEEGDGQAKDSVVEFANLRVAHDDRIVDFEFTNEGRDGVGGVVHGDADDLQALRAVLVLQLDEEGSFFAAGRAPGRPEVEQNYFSAIVGERERFAGELLESEVGCETMLGGRWNWARSPATVDVGSRDCDQDQESED